MPGITTTSTLNGATIPTVPGDLLKLFIAAARMTTQEQGNLKQLVLNDTLPPGMGTTWNSPKIGTFTAYSLTQGVDMAQQQQLTATNVVVTPAEVGVQTIFTKKSLAQWSEDMQTRAGMIMRQAMDRKIDADIGGLAASLTTYSAIGGAGTVMAPGHVMAAYSTLKSGTNTAGTAIAAGAVNQPVPPGPIYGVFRPETLAAAMHPLGGGPVASAPTVATTSIAANGAPGTYQNEVLDSLFVGKLFNVLLYTNANIAKNASDDANGMVFHEDAMVFVEEPHEMAGGDIMIEEDVSLRSIELNMVEDYGFGILDSHYGIEMTFDASPLTS